MSGFSKILCILSICILTLNEAGAQMKAVGPTFCYGGIGISYEHGVEEDSFIDVGLRMETAPFYGDRSRPVGISASFSWNMVFAEAESRNGNIVVFFAGPGAVVGWTNELVGPEGLIFGFKGRIGGECTFRRNVSISISISPVLGMHLSEKNGMMNMLLYKTGILYGIMPEVGVKYAF